MKKIFFSPSFIKKLRLLKKKDTKLFQKISRQIERFQADPQHPSLRLHKLKGELKNVWSISITMDIRILFVDEQEIYFFDLGTHDEVYRK